MQTVLDSLKATAVVIEALADELVELRQLRPQVHDNFLYVFKALRAADRWSALRVRPVTPCDQLAIGDC